MIKIIVIGGGAAGMMAAIFAARDGAAVSLLERNAKLGKKLYITGKGRCNVTNQCDVDAFIREVPRNARFLYSALTFFSPEDMIAFLEQEGCPVVVERGRRVFPQSQKASDVTRTLERVLRREKVSVELNTRVEQIQTQDGRVTGVILSEGQMLAADAVIIATGGKSYPVTGSTGDGYRFAKETGHLVKKQYAALSAVHVQEQWPKELQGLSLKNVTLTLYKGSKKVYQELGEMLFTHFGVSGPLVLSASSHMDFDQAQDYTMAIDLKPALRLEQLELRLRREFEENGNKQLKTVLISLLPGKLAKVFPAIVGFDDSQIVNQVTKALRMEIAQRLKALPLTVTQLHHIDEAIVTRGGVDVKQVDARTMQSKLVSGLYFAGEVLDVDAHTGGYNLQIAFSTGALAGQSAHE